MSQHKKTAVFGAELTAYGENLADVFILPSAIAKATDSQCVGGTLSSVELVVLAESAVTAATLKVEVEDSAGGVTFTPTGWAYTAPAALTKAAGEEITRFCMPSKVRAHVRAKVTTDASATGSLALNLVYLPR